MEKTEQTRCDFSAPYDIPDDSLDKVLEIAGRNIQKETQKLYEEIKEAINA